MSSDIEYLSYDPSSVVHEGDVMPSSSLVDGEMPEVYTPIHIEAADVPTHYKAGPLENLVDDWLELHNIHGNYDDKYACEKLHISYEDYMAEIKASLEAVTNTSPTEIKLGGRAVIEGFRAAREADMTPSEAALHAAAARSRDQSNPKVG